MFCALPAETVFEAKERTRRATVYLFLLLSLMYILFADLMTLSVCLLADHPWSHPQTATDLSGPLLWTSFIAGLLALGHFFWVRAKTLDAMLDQVKAYPADPKDNYHRQFIDLVSEAEAATGIHGIRAIVLSDPGCNAFSLMDGKGHAAIGATEGLLSKLTRPEMEGVVAHEAAHLVHEDSRLVATACFLFAVFYEVNEAIGLLLRSGGGAGGRSNSRGSSPLVIVLVLWLISGLGYFVTQLISMAISREREYLADADGVSMCKDPLALAEGLYKISHRYRGNFPDTYSALFIMNPSESALDEQEGFFPNLFSNHPPVAKRLSKLLAWAKSDLTVLEAADKDWDQAPTARASSIEKAQAALPTFMAYQGNQWLGPYTAVQLMATGLATPSTWISPTGTQQVLRASDYQELLPLFQHRVEGTPGSVAKNACPRCKVSLIQVEYEGAQVEQCSFCKGYLLGPGILERLITRDEVAFSPDDIKKTRVWRDSQRGPLKDRNHFPDIQCPLCGSPMGKSIHSVLTQVVIDHCSNDSCGAIWCDGGELETIQMLIQDARSPK